MAVDGHAPPGAIDWERGGSSDACIRKPTPHGHVYASVLPSSSVTSPSTASSSVSSSSPLLAGCVVQSPGIAITTLTAESVSGPAAGAVSGGAAIRLRQCSPPSGTPEVSPGAEHPVLATSVEPSSTAEELPAPATPPVVHVVLYMYAGEARRNDIASYLSSLGDSAGIEVRMEEVDICRDASHNFLDEGFWSAIKEKIRTGFYAALIVSPPCHTHTRARQNKSNGPPPIRSRTYPWGFPWLSGPRKAKLDEANQLLRVAFEALEEATKAHVPYIFEHPEDLGWHRGGTPASVWQLPELKAIAEQGNAMRRAVHQKDFGTPYLKPTGFLLTLEGSAEFGVLGWPVLDDVGNYVGPLAWRPAPHMKLGKANTAPTAAYPPALCKKIADMLIQTILAQVVYALRPAVGGVSSSSGTGSSSSAGAGSAGQGLPGGGVEAMSRTMELDAGLFGEGADSIDGEPCADGGSVAGDSIEIGVSRPLGSVPLIAPGEATQLQQSSTVGSAVVGMGSCSAAPITPSLVTSSGVVSSSAGATSASSSSSCALVPGSLHVSSMAGSVVASGCGVEVSPNVAAGLRGAFTAEGPLDIWDVGPNTPTSDEDEDGVVKPKKGHGRVGMGPPIMISHGVRGGPS